MAQVDGWSIGRSTAHELARRLAELKPPRILEIGSGNSTVVLAAAAADAGIVVVSLEHEPAYFARTQRLLREAGLEQWVNCQLVPLDQCSLPDGTVALWHCGIARRSRVNSTSSSRMVRRCEWDGARFSSPCSRI